MEGPVIGMPVEAAPPAPHDFRHLFEQEFSYVWLTLRRLGVDERDLEDLTHDTFLQIHRQFAAFDRSRPLRPWLFGFAFRIAADYRRRARRWFEVLGAEHEAADPAPSALERLSQRESLAQAQAALGALDLNRRAVFILHELDDCPLPQVAAALGIPLGTATSRLRSARERFHAAAERLRRRDERGRR